MAKYTLLKQDGAARRGKFETVHGTVQTPAFMNVATSAAIKGGLSTDDLKNIGCQVMLCNTYHLHVRPGDDLVYDMGGLHKFTNWDRPILTDSGGFQVFSLAKLNKITEDGVTFNSHIDGKKIFMGPEESMQIQSHLGSTGLSAVRLKWTGSTAWKQLSIKTNFFSALTKVAFMMNFVFGI